MKRARMNGLSLLLVFLVGFAAGQPDSLTRVDVSVEPESRLWIEGTSTVSAFTCEASEVDGYGTLAVPAGVRGGRADGTGTQPEARLAVPVLSFDCGRSRMNADFYRALKTESYREISFELVDADPQGALLPEGWQGIRAVGRLTIAGTTRDVDLLAEWRSEGDNRYRIRGKKALTMTSFGIRPPVALLGLIKAHDDIEVHFDLLAETAAR